MLEVALIQGSSRSSELRAELFELHPNGVFLQRTVHGRFVETFDDLADLFTDSLTLNDELTLVRLEQTRVAREQRSDVVIQLPVDAQSLQNFLVSDLAVWTAFDLFDPRF
ncbi:hypothetical protein D3C71_769720 [compost metagenome]